jgi:hypothetical protein
MAFSQQAFTFRSTPLSPSPSGSIDRDGLCHECFKLDMEESFANVFALYEGARRGRNTRKLEVYRSVDSPPYLGHFYYVASLGNRLSIPSFCRLCDFLKRTCQTPAKGSDDTKATSCWLSVLVRATCLRYPRRQIERRRKRYHGMHLIITSSWLWCQRCL